ncbi:MAG: magnesium/cobalt transporter CorA, partial [Actinobacteria bacterium]|nr:magnesium/cobalt transporter CorA [Actinomycetota bacterium]
RSKIRKAGSDYLAYLLIDSIIDNYFSVLENVGERIENIENKLVSNPSPKTLKAIHNLKRDMLFLRKSVWPLREVISKLERGEISLIKNSTKIYIRDIYDHIIQVIDTIETYRDMLSGMIDIYLSSISNRLNEVMKILTIISTIFIPITFIASIYGMNFKFMPEFSWKWSYPVVWVIMLAVIITMVIYFKRKKWF